MPTATKKALRPATADAEPERDWEDEFRKLREKHLTQKQLCNEQEEHIKL
jgi:hypothetical protein